MKSGAVWIVEYWSRTYRKWIQTNFWYEFKKTAELEKKEQKDAYPTAKFRVQKYIRAEPKAKKRDKKS